MACMTNMLAFRLVFALFQIQFLTGQSSAGHHHARGGMKLFKASGQPKLRASVLPAECYSDVWPNVQSCSNWSENSTHRMVEGNSIPDHNQHGRHGQPVGPYCPFGKGGGYCLPEEGSACPFDGMICPNQTLAEGLNLTGDVPVPYQIYFEYPLHPDPTLSDLPNHLYLNSALYQQVGVHLNGVHIKGPSEAEGWNVDTTDIPLLCGGHVTPPVGPGPVYHYHKPSTCTHMDTAGQHGPLVGYANDGFAIYGHLDIDGIIPVVDECNGHFGPLVQNGDVTYHYHVHDSYALHTLTFDKQEPSFQPYWIGCQGPSLQKCNTTIAKAPKGETDLGHVWCGVGCGYDVCVQPGTTEKLLKAYLRRFPGGARWLRNKTLNSYENYPTIDDNMDILPTVHI